MSQRTKPVKTRQVPQGAHRSGRRRRRVRFGAPPPRALALSGWALVPLRAFLGFTFCFAGLQKLANPNFLNANSPSSIQAQLIASIRISPLHELLGHLLRFAVPIGIIIALAELAVGLGTILGLWTRVAAAGGMVLAFTLFLTVSFHSSPYYTGADIVFVFAWIPLILAGSGGVLSLDGVIAERVAGEHDLGPPTIVPVRFALVQEVCGNYENDSCMQRGAAAATSAAARSCRPSRPGTNAARPREVSTRSTAGLSYSGVPPPWRQLWPGASSRQRRPGSAGPWAAQKALGARVSRLPLHARTRRVDLPTARPRRLRCRRLPARRHHLGLGLARPVMCRSAGRRGSPIQRQATLVWSFNPPRTASSPTTRSVHMPGARSAIHLPPTSSCVRVTAPSSTPTPAQS